MCIKISQTNGETEQKFEKNLAETGFKKKNNSKFKTVS